MEMGRSYKSWFLPTPLPRKHLPPALDYQCSHVQLIISKGIMMGKKAWGYKLLHVPSNSTFSVCWSSWQFSLCFLSYFHFLVCIIKSTLYIWKNHGENKI